MQYFSFSSPWRGCAFTPMQHSPTQCLSSLDHTSWAIQGVKVLAVCLQVHQQTHKLLGSCLVHCSAVLEPSSSLRKGFVIMHNLPNVHTVTGSFIGVIP